MIVLLLLVLLVLMLAPQFLSQRLLRHYGKDTATIAGTGAELARHLIDRFQLKGVGVEETQQGDHYDPRSRMVRLRPEHFKGRSISAVSVAAHEVGHAIQDVTGSGGLRTRGRLAVVATLAMRLAQIAAIAAPIMVSVSPGLARVALIIMLLGIGLSTLMHLVTLPVEWDASFNKALPILLEGRYLEPSDMVAAKKILTACAFTYVSGSLGALLNMWRWIRFLR